MISSIFGTIVFKNQRPVKTASTFGLIDFPITRYKYHRIARTGAGVEAMLE